MYSGNKAALVNIVSGYNITTPSNFAQLCITHTLRGLASVVRRILRLLGLIPSVFGNSFFFFFEGVGGGGGGVERDGWWFFYLSCTICTFRLKCR